MCKKIVFGLALMLGISMLALAESSNLEFGTLQLRAPANGPTRTAQYNLDEILYFEDWESGDLAGWVPTDLTATGSTWHLDDYSAFGGAGTSWWVGDPDVGTLGGYMDDWYMTLNSPQVQLGENPGLLFWQRYSTENPGGEPVGYDSWDGCNIRVSTDGGTTWTVITTVTPAYNSTSSYAFGFQHGEGVGVPQWCNTTTGVTWHQVTADLSAWANQTVMIRWAFGSDPGFSTPDNNAMFGWMVDNIRVYSGTDTLLSTNADAEDGFSGSTQVPVGGNLWRIAQDQTAPHGPNILVCNNTGTNLYNPNMNTVCTSPVMDISDLSNGLLIADVAITGEVICTSETFPDCDFWGIEVSTDDGATWCRISNPDCGGAQNFVYIDFPAEWAQFNDSFTDIMDMSRFLLLPEPPPTIQFRFTFETNADDQFAFGPKFDGFVLDFQAGFPNDITCYTLQVKYPTMVNRPISVNAYYENVGGIAQAQVPAWWRVTGMTQQRFLPNLQLEPGSQEVRTAALTLDTDGLYEIKAWSALTTDQDTQNDTSAAPPIIGTLPEDGEVYDIEVLPEGSDLELGYDNRHVVFRYNYATGNGPLVHFTPEADGVEMPYNLNAVLGSFTSVQTGSQPIRVHVYDGGTDAPGTEVYDEEITVAANETGTNVWKSVDLTGVAECQGLEGDFWVWFEVVTTGTDRFPQILGNEGEEWDGEHFYTWTGTGSPTASTVFFQIHAQVEEVQAIGDPGDVAIPASWNLAQNYPNPFNPSTEIQYSVPRADHMTLKVYNLIGQQVATLVDGMVDAGVHTISFDGAGLSSGVYVYRLDANGFSQSRKMLLMK